MSLRPLDELVEVIKGVDSEWEEIPNDTSFFRSVEQKLEACFAYVSPEEIRAELFSAYLMLEHILTVLTGDVRYHEKSDKLVKEIFCSISKLLAMLGCLVETSGRDCEAEFRIAYADSVRIYLTNVRQINELLKIKA